MAGKRKLDFSASEQAIRRELAYLQTLPRPNLVGNVKKWTYTGSVSNSSALGYLAFAEDEPCSPKVQSSVETPGLPSSSTGPQNPIKEEPYPTIPTEPPGFEIRTPAKKVWIGPSTPSEGYANNINPTLQKNVPHPRPGLIPRTTISTCSQSRAQKPTPNTSQHPKPNTPQLPCIPTMARSSIKRKMPRPTKKLADDELWCQLCQVICSSAYNMQQHLRGRPHKAKMEWSTKPQDKNVNGGGSRGNNTCDVCQIRCPDMDALGMHLKGKKHKGKLQEDADKKRLVHCDACGVQCMNEDSFRQHLKGRQHAMKDSTPEQYDSYVV